MQGKYKHTSTPHLKYTCLTRFWATVLNFSGLLRKGKGSHSGSQNDGLVWLAVVWLGHLRLVRVSPASIEWFFINIFICPFKVYEKLSTVDIKSVWHLWNLSSLCWNWDGFVFLQVCHWVFQLFSDLQKQAVLVWKPGPSGNSGQNRNPAHLAWGKATVNSFKPLKSKSSVFVCFESYEFGHYEASGLYCM